MSRLEVAALHDGQPMTDEAKQAILYAFEWLCDNWLQPTLIWAGIHGSTLEPYQADKRGYYAAGCNAITALPGHRSHPTPARRGMVAQRLCQVEAAC